MVDYPASYVNDGQAIWGNSWLFPPGCHGMLCVRSTVSVSPTWDSKQATTMIGQMAKLTIDDRMVIPQFNEVGDFFGFTH